MTNSFVSNKYLSQSIISNVSSNKNELLKHVRLAIAITLISVKFCDPYLHLPVFVAFFIPSFTVLSGYYCVSLNLVAVLCVLDFDKFHDTGPKTDMQSPVGPFRSYRKSSNKPPSLISTPFLGEES